jgi:hypothetical protein
VIGSEQAIEGANKERPGLLSVSRLLWGQGAGLGIQRSQGDRSAGVVQFSQTGAVCARFRFRYRCGATGTMNEHCSSGPNCRLHRWHGKLGCGGIAGCPCDPYFGVKAAFFGRKPAVRGERHASHGTHACCRAGDLLRGFGFSRA